MIVSSAADLLRATGRESLVELQDAIDADNDFDVVLVADGVTGIEVRAGWRGIVLEFPFAADDVWDAADELETELEVELAQREAGR